MERLPEDVGFRLSWRSYQGRVLSELEAHLGDDHLHVVAPPGSGKTILGLEVVRRLNRPTLILAPTLTIRNQWVSRFVSFFLPSGAVQPDWISTDIRHPGFLTVTTYQALHMALTEAVDEEQDEDEAPLDDVVEGLPEGSETDEAFNLVRTLHGAGVRALVVDECHHLRAHWWRTLVEVKDQLDTPTVVALTATPPYDVPPVEWRNYEELCGPVDAEISVPELVRAGDLCPHQDYVYLSTPSREEAATIRAFRTGVETIINSLQENEAFIAAIENHSDLEHPDTHIEAIFSDPEYHSSMVVFLHAVGRPAPKRFLEVMGLSNNKIPKLDREWLEILLTGCLYNDEQGYTACEDVLDAVRRDLQRLGAVERRRVVLRNPKQVGKMLSSSVSKFGSIANIVRLERDSMGPDLRMVILTDYIRKDDLPKAPDDLKDLKRIGVAPIFELLRRGLPDEVRLGVLTGSLVIVPRDACDKLKELASRHRIATANIHVKPLKHDVNYCSVDIAGKGQARIVRLITDLFSTGGIRVLVGTTALLGEGWDAPSINSLVLASFVGSYMLSNQMRGRAIRVQSGNPTKTANIWHPTCLEEGPDPGHDLSLLSRRFRGFVGVSFAGPFIENGVGRLQLGDPPFRRGRIAGLNETMAGRATDRDGLRQAWEAALAGGEDAIGMVEEIRASEFALPRAFVFSNTIRAILGEAVAWGYIGAYLVARGMQGTYTSWRVFLAILCIMAAAAGLFMLPKSLKALWLFLKHGSVESSIKQVGIALLRTLIHTGDITTDVTKIGVRAEKGEFGTVCCFLVGATPYEVSLFLKALQELLNPIDNPRYVITRRGAWRMISQVDYHAVPKIIGRKKDRAEHFAAMWRKYVGPTHLIYTRSAKGRSWLIKARAHAMSTSFQERSTRRSCWR